MGGSSVLVTGGSSGIGRAVVEALLAEGGAVAFTYRSGETAAREIESAAGGKARGYRVDLSGRPDLDELVRAVESDLGPVAGLVNNAGVGHNALLAMTSDDDWERVLGVNLGGAFRCCRAVMRGMLKRRAGSIVNVTSLTALHGRPGQAAYGAAKAGLIGLTRSLAREIGRRGVRANAVVPGFVPTAMTDDLPEHVVKDLRANECLPGGVSAAAVAEAVLFFLSDRSSAITGQLLVVDAGVSC